MNLTLETSDIRQQAAVIEQHNAHKKHPKIIGNLSGLLGKTVADTSTPLPFNSAKGDDNTGILLLALGHPYYGEMAAALAMSLKCSGSPKIHLVYHGDALKYLSEKKLALFDSMSLCPDEAIMKKGKITYFKAKTWMYELSPFENTLFLDVDMLWLSYRSVNALIASLLDVEWTIQNREYYDLSDQKSEQKTWMWGKVSDLRKHFQTGKLYSLHSELVWFKKTEKNKEYFDYVRMIYDEPPIPPTEFAGDVADELAFAYACLMLNRDPHKTPFLPVYWYKLDSKAGTEFARIKDKFFAFSVGGNNLNALEKKKYDMLAKGYAHRMGITNPFSIKPKKAFLKERQAL